MTEIAQSIDLNLSQKLREPAYRRKFFWAESSARIAAALILLRKRRGLSQKQVAEITGTKQPAISRAEQADYQNWNLSTLRSIAEALDARIRVLIEPAEDVLDEYEEKIQVEEHSQQRNDSSSYSYALQAWNTRVVGQSNDNLGAAPMQQSREQWVSSASKGFMYSQVEISQPDSRLPSIAQYNQ